MGCQFAVVQGPDATPESGSGHKHPPTGNQSVALMVVGDLPPRPAPEPCVRLASGSSASVSMSRRWSHNSASIWRTRFDPAGGWGHRFSAITSAIRPRARDRATAARIWAQKTSTVRPGAQRPSNPPAHQSTSPKLYTLVLAPGASTQHWPHQPFRHHTRGRVGWQANGPSSWR